MLMCFVNILAVAADVLWLGTVIILAYTSRQTKTVIEFSNVSHSTHDTIFQHSGANRQLGGHC